MKGCWTRHFGFGIPKNINKKTLELTDIATLNHVIGLPEKNGVDKPLDDYEKIIFDPLVTQNYNTYSSNKHVWIKWKRDSQANDNL